MLIYNAKSVIFLKRWMEFATFKIIKTLIFTPQVRTLSQMPVKVGPRFTWLQNFIGSYTTMRNLVYFQSMIETRIFYATALKLVYKE